jgi:flagellar hook-associated protein 2
MSIAPLRFTGISAYSEDFQAIVDRAVSIANLPVKALQQDQMQMLSQKAALGGLNSAVAQLASGLRSLGSLSEGGATRASSSSTARLTVSAASGAPSGAWQVDSIDSIAEAAIATSTQGYANAGATAVAGAGKFLRLTVGAESHDISLTGAEDNLTAIRDRINSLGAGVSAAVLYSGGADAKYYLTLTATETGAQGLSLEARSSAAPENPGTELVSITKPGTDAELSINGVTIRRPSNIITDAIAGLTLNVVSKTSGEPVQISSSLSRTAVQDGLKDFAASYNAMVEAIDAQIGESAGMLSGNALVRQLRSQLSTLSAFSRSGPIANFSNAGLVFDKNGVLSVDDAQVLAMTSEQTGQLLDFLNGEDGLASLAGTLDGFSDLNDGLIQQQIAEFDETDARVSRQLEEMNFRIGAMQESLLARLQQADALLATLDSQRNMLDASIQSLNMVLYGKKSG